MKSMILLAGLIGFCIGVGCGLIREKTMPAILLHASIAMYAAGTLVRWWASVWIKCLKQANRTEQDA